MKLQLRGLMITTVAAFLTIGCEKKPAQTAAPQKSDVGNPIPEHPWLEGDVHNRIDTLSKHLRGNDVVMWEIERRHIELYKAIRSDNVEYAKYQLEKVVVAMTMGAERRPARKPSFDWFFDTAIPPMRDALASGDANSRFVAYQTFTAQCVTCHGMEKVPHIPVSHPWDQQ